MEHGAIGYICLQPKTNKWEHNTPTLFCFYALANALNIKLLLLLLVFVIVIIPLVQVIVKKFVYC